MNEFGWGIFHVDHLVPVTNPLVCSLHVHTNLRVASAVENRAKGNWLWPQMPLMDWSTMDLLLASR